MNYSVAYWDQPDQVLWIDLEHRRLQGFDTYWLKGNQYGVCNDNENMVSMYEGRQWAAYELTDEGEIEIEQPTPPEGAMVWRGFMLTDEQAKFVGIL